MRTSGAHEARRQTTTDSKAKLFAWIVIAVSVALFAFSVWLSSHPGLLGSIGLIITQLCGVAVAGSILSLFWDLGGRRALMKEAITIAKLADEVERAGLIGVSATYLDNIQWDRFFQGATSLDVFLGYGNTWTELHRERLTELAAADARIRVVFPDPDHPETMDYLAMRSDKSRDEVACKVRGAITKFKDILKDSPRAKILLHVGPQNYATYRAGQRLVVTLYRNHPQKSHVPCFAFVDGEVGRLISSDLDAVIGSSKECWPGKSGSPLAPLT